MQSAAQSCCQLLYQEFADSLVLVRVFGTGPVERLPQPDRNFLEALAAAKGVLSLLNLRTTVLSLLGTRGDNPAWDDRSQSSGHLAIPLISADFVDSIPMIARLMSDMKLGPDWLDEPGTAISTKSLQQIAGVFYVRDAPTWLDNRQRQIVSEQQFVADYGIKTVFGLGGVYLDGSFVTIIMFTRETLDQAQVERLTPLIIAFKIATMKLQAVGAMFGN